MDFQPPSFVRPRVNTIPQSIDELFNAYRQSKTQEIQAQGAQNQLATQQAEFASNNLGLSPQRFNAGLATLQQPPSTSLPPGMLPNQPPAPSLYGPPQGQGPAIQAPPPINANPGLGQAQELPPTGDAALAQQILLMHARSQGIGAEQALAGLKKTQAESQKVGAEAELTDAQVKMLGGSDATVNHFVNQIKSGNMTLDDLSSLGRGDIANSIKVGVSSALASQGVNTNALSNQQTKNKATAAYEGGADVQGKARTAASIIRDANDLKDITSKLGTTDYQLINKYGLAAAAQKGSVAAQDALDQSKLVADRFQALVGGGSDAKLELGLNLFNAAKTKDQIQRSVERVTNSLNNYSSSLRGNGANVPSVISNQGNQGSEQIVKAGFAKGLSRDAIKAQLKAAGY